MSSYFNEEAQESDGEDEEYTELERKKLKKMKQMQSDSSEEDDEDDDDEKLAEENKGFINDDEEEEEDDEGSDSDQGGSDSDGETKRKRDNEDDDLDEDNLDDDDLDLIEENIGVKIDRKKKFKRLKRIEDEDSDDEEKDARTQIANEIFEGSDEEMRGRSPLHPTTGGDYPSEEEQEESDDEGSFIVDDEGRPLQKQKKKPVFADEGLEAARDIFGCDFDYGEFEKYEDWDERDEESEDDEYEDEEDGEREVSRRPKDKRKVSKKSIYDVFEPSDLERGHLTSQDHEIQKTDCPERFQTRLIPVTSSRSEGEERRDDRELEEEAKWIYYHAFYRPYISNQEGREEARKRNRRDHRVTQNIFNALDLIRNSTCEVPFIAFYRKEEVQPELNIHDLWKVFKFDEKWCQLKGRKDGLLTLFQRMSEYQTDVLLRSNEDVHEDTKVIDQADMARVDGIQTPEEFNDVYKHFLLYFGRDQENMKSYLTSKNKKRNVRTITKTIKVRRKIRRKKNTKKKANIGDEDDDDNNEHNAERGEGEGDKEEGEEGEEEEVETEVETEVEEEVEEEENEEEAEVLKKPIRRHEYEFLRKAGVGAVVKKFGLTPGQFAENVRDSYQRYEVEDATEDPLREAEKYLSKICTTPESVLEASIRMVGWQLACEPLVRRTIREMYFERARISVRPTTKGAKLIDEHHPLYAIKYLRDKPVSDLQGDQFLKIKAGVEEKVITFSLSDIMDGHTSVNYLDEMKQLYYKDEFSQVVQDWNELRGRAVEFAFARIIMDLKRELAQRLYFEAKENVLEMCCRKLYNWLKVAPYNPGDFTDEDEDDWDMSKGFRVLAIAYTSDLSQAAFGCIIDNDGECANFIRLPSLLKRKTSYNEREVSQKEDDISRLRDYIVAHKPHVVAIGAESREALMVVQDVQEILKELEDQEQFPKINVELLDNELSSIYSMSKKGQLDFIDYPPLLRQAVSLGRRMQNPLAEFSQLCNSDDEILNLKYHSLQYQMNPSELLDALRIEFINRTNEVGVDLNNAVAFPHTQNLVQFVCGLGPRKAHNLIKSMKQNNNRLENRNQLVVNYHMGPKVFINCAGFIRIDTNALGDSDNYIEVLDSTRIHPEAYDWARKMAVDALEYDDDEGKPAEALDEILETPERLSELDLEAFAVELNNQGYGKKNITLYDIRHELNHRYKDFRIPFKSPSHEEVFNMLTKETPDTFYIGKLIQVTVVDFIHRKPRGEQLDNANPVRNEETGLWQCPFCLKNDFPELSEVWNHFDAEDCPGQAVGVRVRLDNAISGFISIKNLSDKTVTNPAERVRRRGIVYTRILKIDPEKFSVELTSRSSDLQDVDNKWRLPKDAYYDYSTESKDVSKEKKKSEKKKTQYHKRVIAHPSFKNIDYNESEKLMQTMDQGDAIIRPSSKGVDHLTVTWKVSNGICQHIDVREQDKRNDFSLGQKLWIGHEEFEDLDEILARFVAPMASNARQIIDYKYYKEAFAGSKEKAAEYLKEEKKKNIKTIPYVFSSVKVLPGKFLLSYLPRVKVIHEYVSVLPEGYKFRKDVHSTLSNLLKWFKMNFRAVSKAMVTPGRITNRTPYLNSSTPSLSGIEPSAIQKVAQNLPSHMLHSLSAAASSTPHFGTPFSSSYSTYATTPYTPSGQTPFMTPYATPGPSLTPRYGARTPSQPAPFSSRPQMANQNGGPASTPARRLRSETDWQKAAAAWANAQGGRSSRNSFSQRTPRRGDDQQRIITPHYSDDRASSQYEATPRSIRSTPKTINSPSNMSIGVDQTPLYDE